MKTHLSVPFGQKKQGKILHITDMHLFADENMTLMGTSTNASFKAVINEIKSTHNDLDLIVVTGDVVQDKSEEAYLCCTEIIKQLSIPCVWVPGNHDVYSKMHDVFTEQGYPENKVVLFGDEWLLVLLNSQLAHQAAGMLSDDELDFLDNTLQAYSERSAIIFLHHHPVPSGSDWLDQHKLKNNFALEKIICKYKKIKSIAWGHIHQLTEQFWHHCQVFSTPSTCFQFKPNSVSFGLDNLAPSWRIIELNNNGELLTEVHSLKNDSFCPDINQVGY